MKSKTCYYYTSYYKTAMTPHHLMRTDTTLGADESHTQSEDSQTTLKDDA
jgi:hypothetical protein